ncbi:MAG: hypothetical protein R6V61_12260 [Wenzhouxiangellaceae bacterium]
MIGLRQSSSILVLGAVLLGMSHTANAQAPSAADQCFGCHNEDGVSDSPNIPTIAGMGDFFLENQLTIFAESARPCLVDFLEDREAVDKCALIGALPENTRAALAEYFDGLSFESFDQPVDQVLAEQGAALHGDSCDRCHTANGTETWDDAGILAGQPIPYLVRQLRNFREGKRWQPESMARETEALTNDQIEALANFYAGAAL